MVRLQPKYWECKKVVDHKHGCNCNVRRSRRKKTAPAAAATDADASAADASAAADDDDDAAGLFYSHFVANGCTRYKCQQHSREWFVSGVEQLLHATPAPRSFSSCLLFLFLFWF